MRMTFAGVMIASVLASGVARADADREIASLEERVKVDSKDFIAWNRLGDLCLSRLRANGRLTWLARASKATDASLEAVAAELNPAGLALRARVDLAQHRFASARDRCAQLLAAQPGRTAARMTLAEALLELGDLDEAGRVLEAIAEADGQSIGLESRLARLAWLRGQIDAAREHFATALELASELTPPDLVTLAWCHVQLGETDFRTGKWTEAEASYLAALKAVPDGWAAVEHLAELRGAQGKDAEATELFTKAATATERPEVWQALGDLHLFSKRRDEARSAHDRALAGYKASIDRGEVLYIHHLAGFYSDSVPDYPEAVKWARKDLELRRTGAAHDALAWALYRAGDTKAAVEESKKSVASGLIDPHVLYHAGLIHMSAGEIAEGQRLLRRCAEVNPHFAAFHVHR
jgi:tetratricopeptide (TPR) repeat protein